MENALNVSSLKYAPIHISLLITIIKNNKRVSLLFNIRLNIFTNSLSSILTHTSLQLYFHINLF